MTIKEFIKSALTEKEKPYQALINKLNDIGGIIVKQMVFNIN